MPESKEGRNNAGLARQVLNPYHGCRRNWAFSLIFHQNKCIEWTFDGIKNENKHLVPTITEIAKPNSIARFSFSQCGWWSSDYKWLHKFPICETIFCHFHAAVFVAAFSWARMWISDVCPIRNDNFKLISCCLVKYKKFV